MSPTQRKRQMQYASHTRPVNRGEEKLLLPSATDGEGKAASILTARGSSLMAVTRLPNAAPSPLSCAIPAGDTTATRRLLVSGNCVLDGRLSPLVPATPAKP